MTAMEHICFRWENVTLMESLVTYMIAHEKIMGHIKTLLQWLFFVFFYF